MINISEGTVYVGSPFFTLLIAAMPSGVLH